MTAETALANRRYRLGLAMFTDAVRWLRWWLLAGLVLAAAGGPLIVLAWGGTDSGVWDAAAAVLQWFAAVTAGVFLNGNLVGLITRGVTRRELTVAFLVFGALASAGFAVFATAGYAIEHVALGLAARPLDTLAGVFTSGARYLLVTPVYFFAGAAVIAVALRIGKEGAFMTVVFLLFPALLISGTLGFDIFGQSLSGAAAFAVWLAAGTAFLAALVAAVVLSLRSLPVPQRTA
jgi:hypothetical protein